MTNARPRLDFIVIGAIKAATTWVQAQLGNHPDVFVPDIEPHFFTRDHDRGWDWYRSLFPDEKAQGTLWGEKTADYLAKPEATDHIAREYPQARLIVQLRNPIDRAYSDYKMLYRRGTVSGLPEEYLSSPGSAQPRFLNDGLYARHLTRWLEQFSPEQLLVFTFDDVRDTPRETFQDVCDHIGARFHYDPDFASRKQNDSKAQHLPLPVRKALSPLKPLAHPYRDSAVFKATRGLFAKKISYPPLSADLRQRLADFYAYDVEELGKMLNRDLSHWLDLEKRVDAA
ncbi:sulfotransferase family protein [Erythrobacter sp. MTPC3]|uniref:sulfotransferase family protein n=1 Tax=Erythrobacter sp. MTPC3 TaxID=3056564 RepID=UPI0036F1BF8B